MDQLVNHTSLFRRFCAGRFNAGGPGNRSASECQNWDKAKRTQGYAGIVVSLVTETRVVANSQELSEALLALPLSREVEPPNPPPSPDNCNADDFYSYYIYYNTPTTVEKMHAALYRWLYKNNCFNAPSRKRKSTQAAQPKGFRLLLTGNDYQLTDPVLLMNRYPVILCGSAANKKPVNLKLSSSLNCELPAIKTLNTSIALVNIQLQSDQWQSDQPILDFTGNIHGTGNVTERYRFEKGLLIRNSNVERASAISEEEVMIKAHQGHIKIENSQINHDVSSGTVLKMDGVSLEMHTSGCVWKGIVLVLIFAGEHMLSFKRYGGLVLPMEMKPHHS